MSETVIAEIEVDFKEGKETIKAELKQPHEIDECKEDTYVMLNLVNGEVYSGFYKGIDDETIMLGALSGGSTIGLELNWIDNYFEQVK